MMTVSVSRATHEHIDNLISLFDEYRVFYNQSSDKEGARKFLTERLQNEDSLIYIVINENVVVGFTQLYFTFSSISMERSIILNDLYVRNTYRNKGFASMLLNHAKKYCRENNYKGIALETGKENPAQFLYERLDWKKDEEYLHYYWTKK